ncbi:MAG TPA: methyltransferase domain-containing protein [Candidatus Nanoarchaeia archaeon]|nr:methyltransferase domain-containing protein [Candidatus Nanoarchaeia archaeon]
MKKASFDIFGNIALVKFPRGIKAKDKKLFADKLLHDNKSVTTVLEKTRGFRGRLRKQETKWLAGEKTKEVLYRENGCVFRFNIDKTYFSPRLSNERKEIAQKIKKGDEVLVMFAGVAPYSIVIAKNSGASKVVSIEINKEANKYAKMNVELNGVKGKVEIIQGDVKRIANKIKEKYDVIVMPRP